MSKINFVDFKYGRYRRTSLVANECITVIRYDKTGDVTESYYFAPDALNSIQFLISPQPTRSYWNWLLQHIRRVDESITVCLSGKKNVFLEVLRQRRLKEFYKNLSCVTHEGQAQEIYI